jgi:hypothetical protein
VFKQLPVLVLQRVLITLQPIWELLITAANFSAPDGFLTLTNGSFKLNNTGLTITPFTADITTDNFLIPANAGLWVNAGTINSTNMNWTVAGLVKVTGGTLKMGNTANNLVIPQNTAHFTVTSGIMNLASAISNPGAEWTLDMQGGTITVNMLGSTVPGIAPFNMNAAGCVFNISGGTIIIQNSGGSVGQDLSYNNLSTSGTGFTGGTLQLGNASTAAVQSMLINSANPVYNLTIGSSNIAAELRSANLTVSNNVTVSSGSLDIHNNTLTIGGGINNSGTFTVGNGAIIMNGAVAQTIPAAAFTGNLVKNLTVSNNAGVTLAGTLNLSDILLVTSGQLNTGGYLTLLSTATKTALIDGSGAGSVIGDVAMQRYLAAGYGYKYFSSPFQTATVSNFSGAVDLTGNFANFYTYIENQATTGFTPYTTGTNILNPLQGYAADFGSVNTTKTISITGAVNNGAISATLFNHDQPYTQGFSLVGNPYPSPIDWSASSGWTKTNIDDAVYFFDSSNTSQYTGTYSTYINGVSSDGIAGNIIASMQGFFVHVSSGTYPVTGTLAVNNNVRVNNLAPVFHKSTFSLSAVVPRTLLRLSANFSDNKLSSDASVIYTNALATSTFNKELDAIKLININEQVPNLYLMGANASKLAINALLKLDTLTVIPLGLQISKDGQVTFNLRDLEQWPGNLSLYFNDAENGINQDLQQSSSYTISLNAGTYENRFSLRCKPSATLNPAANKGDIYYVYKSNGVVYMRIKLVNDQKGTLMVTNMMGRVLSRRAINGNGEYELEGRMTENEIYVASFATSGGVYAKKFYW